jgi:hypothetical protein
MQIERIVAEPSSPPFPIYSDAVEQLLRAHQTETAERDPAVAHILGVLSGYSYADLATISMMAARLGLGESVCVRVAQTVDAMMIFSTAYLVQSRCGRVTIVVYRGTEPANVGNWLGDADVGSQTIDLGGQPLVVHSGFYRNVRATRWPILEHLRKSASHPEALYVTGHSLGGAMAVLFALGLAGHAEHRALSETLRAVYTFGQPLVAGGPAPEIASAVGRKLYRHVLGRDIIPNLPPKVWGSLEHFGHEFHFERGEWRKRDRVSAQAANFRDVSRAVLAVFAPAKKRDVQRFTMADHQPHQYLSALRPAGKITEFGDQG